MLFSTITAYISEGWRRLCCFGPVGPGSLLLVLVPARVAIASAVQGASISGGWLSLIM